LCAQETPATAANSIAAIFDCLRSRITIFLNIARLRAALDAAPSTASKAKTTSAACTRQH